MGKAMKYNYVIFGTDGDFFTLQISEILDLDNVRWIPYRTTNIPRVLINIYRAHTTWKVNDHVYLPLKSIWNPLYFKDDFKERRPLCFIFYSSGQNYDLGRFGYLDYLRKKYPSCKLVLCFMDLVDAHYSRCHDFSIEYIKKNYDLVLVYNQIDADKYGFVHYTGYLSRLPVFPNMKHFQSDVVFIGRAKDRLDLLLDVYRKLTDNGLKCDFHITDVPKEKQEYGKDIVYNEIMPYTEMVQRSVNSRCILEVTQKGVLGFTSRCSEAIMYDKLLLTNNPIVFGIKFYNPKWMKYFETTDDIDIGFIDKYCDKVNYHYNGELSPLRMLDLIENHNFNKREK